MDDKDSEIELEEMSSNDVVQESSSEKDSPVVKETFESTYIASRLSYVAYLKRNENVLKFFWKHTTRAYLAQCIWPIFSTIACLSIKFNWHSLLYHFSFSGLVVFLCLNLFLHGVLIQKDKHAVKVCFTAACIFLYNFNFLIYLEILDDTDKDDVQTLLEMLYIVYLFLSSLCQLLSIGAAVLTAIMYYRGPNDAKVLKQCRAKLELEGIVADSQGKDVIKDYFYAIKACFMPGQKLSEKDKFSLYSVVNGKAKVVEGEKPKPPVSGGIPFGNVVSNYINGSLAVIFMSLPAVFKDIGLVPAIILMCLSSILSALTTFWLHKSQIKVQILTRDFKAMFEDVGYYLFGPWMFYVTKIGIVGYITTFLILFTYLMHYLVTVILDHLFPGFKELENKKYITAIIVFIFNVVLSGLPGLRPANIKWYSYQKITALFLMFFFVIIYYFIGHEENESADLVLIPDMLDYKTYFKMIGTFAKFYIGFGSHAIFGAVSTAVDKKKDAYKLTLLVFFGSAVQLVVYVTFSIFGYLTFFSNTGGSIVAGYPEGWLKTWMAFVAFNVVAFTYPLVNNSIVGFSWQQFWYGVYWFKRCLGKLGLEKLDVTKGKKISGRIVLHKSLMEIGKRKSKWMAFFVKLFFTFLIALFCFFICVYVPDSLRPKTIILMILVIFATFVVFVFPAMFFLKLFKVKGICFVLTWGSFLLGAVIIMLAVVNVILTFLELV